MGGSSLLHCHLRIVWYFFFIFFFRYQTHHYLRERIHFLWSNCVLFNYLIRKYLYIKTWDILSHPNYHYLYLIIMQLWYNGIVTAMSLHPFFLIFRLLAPEISSGMDLPIATIHRLQHKKSLVSLPHGNLGKQWVIIVIELLNNKTILKYRCVYARAYIRTCIYVCYVSVRVWVWAWQTYNEYTLVLLRYRFHRAWKTIKTIKYCQLIPGRVNESLLRVSPRQDKKITIHKSNRNARITFNR